MKLLSIRSMYYGNKFRYNISLVATQYSTRELVTLYYIAGGKDLFANVRTNSVEKLHDANKCQDYLTYLNYLFPERWFSL